jgi:hypothetical protein
MSVEEWYYVAFPPFLLLYGKLTKGSGEWSGYVGAAVVFIAAITLRTVYGDTVAARRCGESSCSASI